MFYRVDYPEQLTAGINLRNGSWQIDDVRGYKNSKEIDDALEEINFS